MLRQVESLKSESDELPLADLAASFEQIVADVLVERSLRCCLDQGLDQLIMVGGVAANHFSASMSRNCLATHLHLYLEPLL